MHAADLRTLVHYNYWARDRMLDAVAKLAPELYTKPLGNSFSSVRDTVVHLYGAEWIWFTRFKGQSPMELPRAAEFPDLNSVRAAWGDVESGWRSLVANIEDGDVDTVIAFKTMAGATANSPLGPMIQHVVNHASYHRGQVTTMLRQLGADPPKSMDLIYYHREQAK
jgi:uncharacterized damage-inducible protein DinB